MIWPFFSRRFAFTIFWDACSKHRHFSRCGGNYGIFWPHIIKNEGDSSSVFERFSLLFKEKSSMSTDWAGKSGTSWSWHSKTHAYLLWSGGEECGEEQEMLLERTLLWNVAVVVRRPGISRRWFQCKETGHHQHCFAGDRASCLCLRRLIFWGRKICPCFFLWATDTLYWLLTGGCHWQAFSVM